MATFSTPVWQSINQCTSNHSSARSGHSSRNKNKRRPNDPGTQAALQSTATATKTNTTKMSTEENSTTEVMDGHRDDDADVDGSNGSDTADGTTTVEDVAATNDVDQDDVADVEDEQEKVDEEGLLLEGYDVVVCGTGLVQSLLASAFARSCLKVLHVDSQTFYGQLDATFTPSLIDEELLSKTQEQVVESELKTGIIPINTLGGFSDLKFHSTRKFQWSGIKEGSRVQVVEQKVDGEEDDKSNTKSKVPASSSASTVSREGIVSRITDSKVVIELVSDPAIDQKKNEDGKDKKEEEEEDDEQQQDNEGGDGDESSPPASKKDTTVLEIDLDSSLCNADPIQLEEWLWKNHGIMSLQSIDLRSILEQQERWMALDATPGLVLSSGPAVQGMLSSGVADYVEFKTIQGLYWLSSSSSSSSKASKYSMERVPCSKNDVFSTKLLKPMDKRRLMKFLQLAFDYATKESLKEQQQEETAEVGHEPGEDGMAKTDLAAEGHVSGGEDDENVKSLNERYLNQGRSLARPQNKAVASDELEVLQRCMDESERGMAFDTFLDKEYKLSQSLRHLVRYALAWETKSTSSSSDGGGLSLKDGMKNVRRNVQALGRYGTTAFLVPMYGSGELSQSFCRSAAVFGSTYLLRRAPVGIAVIKKNNSSTVKGVMLAPDLSVDDASMGKQDDSARKSKLIKCNHVIAPSNSYVSKSQKSTLRTLRWISVLKGTILPTTDENNEQRQVIFIPPEGLDGKNRNVIHGIILDESVCVAPIGCTVLHLTTTVNITGENSSDEGQEWVDLMQSAQNAILQSQGDITKDTVEVYHVCFSHPQHSSEQDESSPPKSSDLPTNVHLCHHTGQALTVDVAFEQAQKIFSSVCPGMEFLGLSTAMNERIRQNAVERRSDGEDDEKLMLDSALGMINKDKIQEAASSSSTIDGKSGTANNGSVDAPPSSNSDAVETAAVAAVAQVSLSEEKSTKESQS